MKFGKFSDYRGGWLVGDFNPSLFKTNANDIGVLKLGFSFIIKALIN